MRSLVCTWINWVIGQIDGGSHFRMRIILGTIPIWFLIFNVCVPGCSRNCSRLCPYLRVQEKFGFWQSTQNAGLCPAELLGQIFSDPAFTLLRSLSYLFLINSRNIRVSWLAVPRMFLLSFSCNGCQLSLVSQCCHLLKGKNQAVEKTERLLCSFNQAWEYKKM